MPINSYYQRLVQSFRRQIFGFAARLRPVSRYLICRGSHFPWFSPYTIFFMCFSILYGNVLENVMCKRSRSISVVEWMGHYFCLPLSKIHTWSTTHGCCTACDVFRKGWILYAQWKATVGTAFGMIGKYSNFIVIWTQKSSSPWSFRITGLASDISNIWPAPNLNPTKSNGFCN